MKLKTPNCQSAALKLMIANIWVEERKRTRLIIGWKREKERGLFLDEREKKNEAEREETLKSRQKKELNWWGTCEKQREFEWEINMESSDIMW